MCWPCRTFLSHEIVEEFMIAANVSAAKRLEQSKLPVMFRVHDKPLEEKLKDFAPLLRSFAYETSGLSVAQAIAFKTRCWMKAVSIIWEQA